MDICTELCQVIIYKPAIYWMQENCEEMIRLGSINNLSGRNQALFSIFAGSCLVSAHLVSSPP